jgi:catechol 2,3-dioxygenase-like lactoylglutathione lyase family enzyme
MKYATIALIFAAIATASSAGNAATKHRRQGPPQEGLNMTTVSLGENAKMTVLPSERDRFQRFYRDVLGCRVIEKSNTLDVVQAAPNFYIGVSYDDSALSESEMMKSIWLDLRTDHAGELKQKILKFGIKEIKYWDTEHFYFQAPGGQVFRLVGTTEDMSKWQR